MSDDAMTNYEVHLEHLLRDPEVARMYHRTLAIDGVYLQTCWYGWGLQSGLVRLPR